MLRQLKAYLFHIWHAGEQKEHSPPPGAVVAFAWFWRRIHNCRLTYSLTYLLFYVACCIVLFSFTSIPDSHRFFNQFISSYDMTSFVNDFLIISVLGSSFLWLACMSPIYAVIRNYRHLVDNVQGWYACANDVIRYKQPHAGRLQGFQLMRCCCCCR